jgi:hypothetical protein
MDNCSEKASVPFSILEEVEVEANQRMVEVVTRLLDKLENISTSNVEDLLGIYVAAKVLRHHLKKYYYRGWFIPQMSEETFAIRLEYFNQKILITRRNYYAAKQRRDGTSI